SCNHSTGISALVYQLPCYPNVLMFSPWRGFIGPIIVWTTVVPPFILFCMTAMPSRPARPRRRFDSPEQEAFLNLWRTYDRLRALEDELFNQYALTAQQYNALRLLRGEHPQKVRT